MRVPAPVPDSWPSLCSAGLLVLLLGGLAGCDLTGDEALEKAAAQKEADGKAVGSACRHAGRAIEDCYTLNPKAPRAAIFAGWREMDEYMRENKLEAVAPSLPSPNAKAEKGEKAEARAERADKRAISADAGAGKVELPPKPRVVKPEHS